MKKRSILRSTLALTLAAAMGVSASAQDKSVDVGFIYVGPVGDGGWTFAHDNGRKQMVENLEVEGIEVTTSYVESVPEGPEAERTIREMTVKGSDVVFTTSFGYMDPTLKVARTQPNTTFFHATGYKNAPNMGTYEARTYQGSYLAGILAGYKTESNKLGFVASVPIPEVIRNVNAFTLGAQSVNPDVTTQIVWIGEWFNPAKEKQAAEAMIAEGADVLLQNTDSPAVLQAAQENEVFAFGWDSNMQAYGPKAHLASAVINWGGYYTDAVMSVLNDTFDNSNVWGGVDAGMIDLEAVNEDLLSEEAINAAMDAREQMNNGERIVFVGPIMDQDGNVLAEDGESLDDETLLQMGALVKGVDGSLPQ